MFKTTSSTLLGKFVMVFVFVLFVAFAQVETKLEKLKREIKGELGKQEGTFAVAFKNIKTGEELLLNERETFHAASTMKTPVMIEVFKQASEGRFSLADSVIIKNEFKSIVDGSPFHLNEADDSEFTLYKNLGKKRTISELVFDMIIVSSNLATNIIIELVDAKKVTTTMRSLGANDIVVLRGVEDSKAFALGLNNTVTAYDHMVIFEKIAIGEAVNATASAAMTKILFDQKFNTIIPARLPKDVKVAHKTGWFNGLHHDAGVVYLPDGRTYVLVLLSKNLKDEKASVDAMASVSEMVYKYVIDGK